MLPDRVFNLHKLPLSLRHPSGVYRLVHNDYDFHVSSTGSGRRHWSNVLRIGHSGDLLTRLYTYSAFQSRVPGLDDFLREHYGRILVEVKFVPRRRLKPETHKLVLRALEAEHIIKHATRKGRIPHFNIRGEFRPACELVGKCFKPEQLTEFQRAWADGNLPWRS